MNTYVAQKEYDKAITAANAQIAKSPNKSDFYDLLGTALFNGKKDLPGAEVALKKAIDLDKANTDAIEKLGKVQVQEGASDQAIRARSGSISLPENSTSPSRTGTKQSLCTSRHSTFLPIIPWHRTTWLT
jgi:tetratricopeptide (TPR) repeat protein